MLRVIYALERATCNGAVQPQLRSALLRHCFWPLRTVELPDLEDQSCLKHGAMLGSVPCPCQQSRAPPGYTGGACPSNKRIACPRFESSYPF